MTAPAGSSPETRSASRRTLVGEILLTQLCYAMIVGAVALAALWSGANWIIRDNVSDWAQRWVDDLDALGAGLYHDTDDTRFVVIEGYVAKFPEIAYVHYYTPQGELLYAEQTPAVMPFDAPDLAALQAAGNAPYLFEESADGAYARITAPVTTSTIAPGALFAVEDLELLPVTTEVVGYVELGLDYSPYYAQLWQNMTRVSLALALAFLLLALCGRLLLRKALQPLTDIQTPLTRLANGDTEFQVAVPAHREIAGIADALNTAVARIHERDSHLSYLATHDDLTGLPNRPAFLQRLRSLVAASDECPGAVLFIDLDQFKHVNDMLGHLAGDSILKQVASRLSSSVGDTGVTARFGGDEFGIVAPNVDREQALQLANRIMADLTRLPFVEQAQSFALSCSIGVALADAGRPLSASDLLAFADLACQQAKSAGRNCVRVYEPEEGVIETIKNDILWSRKLQHALKTDAFSLYFQPIADARNGQISHFEVLLRLEDEDGLHSPDAFLSAAERFGLLREIDHWVIEHALRKLAWLRRQDPDLRFTINLSGQTFEDGDLVEFVTGQFQHNSLDPSAVIFEITEQVAVGDLVQATAQVNELITRGCEFAIDDFGAGYSSFTYLKELPMQYLKIDGLFIQHLETSEVDQVLVRAIAEIAQELGKKTIAEFVENEATLELLVEFGIDYVQGHHIGRPGPKIDGRVSAPRAPAQGLRLLS